MTPTPAHIIIDTLGSEAIERALDLTSYSVRAAKRDGIFPARWYGPLSALCRKRGIECPLSAFRWIETDKKVVVGQAGNQ